MLLHIKENIIYIDHSVLTVSIKITLIIYLKNEKKKLVSIQNKFFSQYVLNIQGKILQYNLFLTIATRYSRRASSFCTCSVRATHPPAAQRIFTTSHHRYLTPAAPCVQVFFLNIGSIGRHVISSLSAHVTMTSKRFNSEWRTQRL